MISLDRHNELLRIDHKQSVVDHLEHLQGRKEKLIEYLENAISVANCDFKSDLSTRDITAALANALRELDSIFEQLEAR